MDRVEPELRQALETVFRFVEQVTGRRPSQAEIASALKRYFVLNEIKDHILLDRKTTASTGGSPVDTDRTDGYS